LLWIDKTGPNTWICMEIQYDGLCYAVPDLDHKGIDNKGWSCLEEAWREGEEGKERVREFGR